jgi:hypothetical protein
MGLLAPLFLASLAALSVPLILHLVRRTPRGRQEFSSLMFLSPTPPRLTRRSRFDQILLLLLRLAALALLGFAFTRPFLRENSLLSVTDLPRRRVAILIDNSASMRRADLWQQAIQAAGRELDDLAPQDDVALFAYSDQLHTVAPFPSEHVAATDSAVDIARSELKKLEPSWQIGDLGRALGTLAGELDAASDVQQSLADPQIVVISDFQKGTNLDALTGYDWPERVRIIPRPLAIKKTTNASARLLISRDEDSEPRVRVVNAADSTGDQFFVSWFDARKSATPKETAIYVPPGESRVVRLPRPEDNLQSDRVVLRGDDQDFDNTFFVAPPRKQEVSLVYAGDDAADDAQGLQYYLRLACAGDPLRQVTVREVPKDKNLEFAAARVAVITRQLSEQDAGALKDFVTSGGVLFLAPTEAAAATLPQLLEDVSLEKPKEHREGDFALLGEIDFTHPLFAPLSGPRYNNFTKIHFWHHRPVLLKPESQSTVLARFDDGSPWLLARPVGKGTIFAATSSWSPDDSQLAVSSKFVPLIGNLLDIAGGSTRPLEGLTIGDALPIATGNTVTKPGGSKVQAENGEAKFTQTTEPGIYRTGAADDEQLFAVNLPSSESDTALMQLEQLDQLGVRRTAAVAREERLSRMRQERDTELEGRQKVWRWLLVGSLLFLIGESMWAGIASRPTAHKTEFAT